MCCSAVIARLRHDAHDGGGGGHLFRVLDRLLMLRFGFVYINGSPTATRGGRGGGRGGWCSDGRVGVGGVLRERGLVELQLRRDAGCVCVSVCMLVGCGCGFGWFCFAIIAIDSV